MSLWKTKQSKSWRGRGVDALNSADKSEKTRQNSAPWFVTWWRARETDTKGILETLGIWMASGLLYILGVITQRCLCWLWCCRRMPLSGNSCWSTCKAVCGQVAFRWFSRESLWCAADTWLYCMYGQADRWQYRERVGRGAMQWCGNSCDLQKPVQMSTALVFTGFLAFYSFKGRRVKAGGRGSLRPAGKWPQLTEDSGLPPVWSRWAPGPAAEKIECSLGTWPCWV